MKKNVVLRTGCGAKFLGVGEEHLRFAHGLSPIKDFWFYFFGSQLTHFDKADRFGSKRFGSKRFGSKRFGSKRFGSKRFGSKANFGKCKWFCF